MQQTEDSGIPKKIDEDTDLQQWMKFRIDQQKSRWTERLSDYALVYKQQMARCIPRTSVLP
jgi:hypothetical protein